MVGVICYCYGRLVTFESRTPVVSLNPFAPLAEEPSAAGRFVAPGRQSIDGEGTVGLTCAPVGVMKIENWLLGALLQSGYDHLLAHLEPVSLSYAQTLYEPDEPIQFVYFPNDAVVSLLSLTRDGETIEVGMIGYEGMMDIAVVLGADAIPYRAYVQIPGSGLRMKTEVIRSEFGQVGRLHDLLLRYTHLRITQISQSAVCNRFHPVEQRLCRWLLVAQDRVRSDEI